MVQWEGLPVEESSWEYLTSLQDMFPQLNLEGQVRFHGDRNDIDITTTEEFIKIVEDETEKKKDVEKSTRLRKSSVWTKDYIL